MNRKERRHAHLMAHLARFEKDTDFLKQVNDVLANHPDFDSGISESYLGQLKSMKRTIGDRTVVKLETGLELDDGDFDFPLPEELDLVARKAGDHAELEALLQSLDSNQGAAAIRDLAGQISPKDAIAYARIFLDRAEAAL